MATGERRAIEAAEQAVSSPLLETSVEARRSSSLITGGRDLSLWEVNEAAKAVSEAAHPSANIIFGAMIDDKVEEGCWVTVVATGYGDQPRRRSATTLREPAGEPRIRRTRDEFDLEVGVRSGRLAKRPDRSTRVSAGARLTP